MLELPDKVFKIIIENSLQINYDHVLFQQRSKKKKNLSKDIRDIRNQREH
jgi:hypothetical protein